MNLTHTLKTHRGFIVFLLGLALLRTAVADWNPIPSGSMRPTLLEGDVVLVNRLAYDLKLPLTDVSLLTLGEPARGDVVTLTSPATGVRLIKRIVGLPGDTLALQNGRLVVNGEPARYSGEHTVGETLAPGWVVSAERATETVAGRSHAMQRLPLAGVAHNFGPVMVAPGHYFLMGDNRDNSEDSRVIGAVPRSALIGRAHHLVASADVLGGWLPRFERWGNAIR